VVRVAEVRFGEKIVVKEQEVELEEGLNCLLGPSGLGKSTFLRALLKATGWPYVPQELKFPSGRVEELASHLASLNKCCRPREYLENFSELIEELGIGYVLGRKVETLSSGEKQRLALALQLARGCGRLLADEPTSQLDPKSALRTIEVLREWTELSVVVTHDVSVMAECDRFYTLREGLLVPAGPEELGLPWGCLRDCLRPPRPSGTSPSP